MARGKKFNGWWLLFVLLVAGVSQFSGQRSTTSTTPNPTSPNIVRPAPVAAPVTTPTNPPSSPRRSGLEPGYVNASTLNVRSRPDSSGAILFAVPRGTRIVPLSSVGEWLEVALTDGTTGWVSAKFVSPDPPAAFVSTPAPVAEPEKVWEPRIDRAKVIEAIIQQSMASTGGNCPCPFNTDRAGRRCGARSAYSKPGGASPICYAEQVTPAMIDAFVARN